MMKNKIKLELDAFESGYMVGVLTELMSRRPEEKNFIKTLIDRLSLECDVFFEGDEEIQKQNCDNCGQPRDYKNRCIPFIEGKCKEVYTSWIPKQADVISDEKPVKNCDTCKWLYFVGSQKCCDRTLCVDHDDWELNKDKADSEDKDA